MIAKEGRLYQASHALRSNPIRRPRARIRAYNNGVVDRGRHGDHMPAREAETQQPPYLRRC